MAFLRLLKLKHPGGLLWTAIQSNATPVGSLSYEPNPEKEHPGSLQAALSIASNTYQQHQLVQHPLQLQQHLEDLQDTTDQGADQGASLMQQQIVGQDKPASANIKPNIELACFRLKSFWEQLLEDVDHNRLPRRFGRTNDDGNAPVEENPVNLIDSSKSSTRDKMLWLLRAEEFRLLSEPCEIALWYAAGESGLMQSNAESITKPYAACRPKIYTRLETISLLWAEANCAEINTNDLSMAINSLITPPRPKYSSSMVWAYARDPSCMRPASMTGVELGDPAQLQPNMQCVLLLICSFALVTLLQFFQIGINSLVAKHAHVTCSESMR